MSQFMFPAKGVQLSRLILICPDSPLIRALLCIELLKAFEGHVAVAHRGIQAPYLLPDH